MGILKTTLKSLAEKKLKGKAKSALTKALKFDDTISGFKKFARPLDEMKKLDVMAHKDAREVILDKTQDAAEKAFKRLRKNGGGIGSYYDDIATWLHYEPKNKQEEIEKTFVLSDFLADDNVRTKKGWERIEKQNRQFLGQATGKGTEAARYDSLTALRFLKWKFPDSAKKVSFADVSENMDKVREELLLWHALGEPES